MADNSANRQSQERIAALREETERLRMSAEEARSQREMAHAGALASMKASTVPNNPNGGGMQPAQPRSFGGTEF